MPSRDSNPLPSIPKSNVLTTRLITPDKMPRLSIAYACSLLRLTFASVCAIISPLAPGDGDLEEAKEGKVDGRPLGGKGGREVPGEGTAESYSGG